ncbi:MAG: DLW-39 family protein [Actinomycetota bacterium]|nr:DLW-39 family protein [Actinomycetota bacterium]
MLKKLLMATLAVAGGLAVFRKRKAAQEERTLWHDATTAPDLR